MEAKDTSMGTGAKNVAGGGGGIRIVFPAWWFFVVSGGIFSNLGQWMGKWTWIGIGGSGYSQDVSPRGDASDSVSRTGRSQ